MIRTRAAQIGIAERHTVNLRVGDRPVYDQVRLAIEEFFPHAKDLYSAGPYEFHDHPWLDCVGVSPDGHTIALLIKFWAGGQFCCSSPGCRFGRAFFRTDWADLRRLLRSRGVEPQGPIRFFVRVEYEVGALFAAMPGDPDTDYSPVKQASWDEFETDEAFPERSPKELRSSEG
jgi:hypothetical protein